MNIANILTDDIANGPGVRISVFVSGCLNHCKGCFSPETWDFNYGYPYDQDTEQYILNELSKDYYSGITFLGGDPFEESNQIGLLPLIEKIKDLYPDKNIWMYTGYIYEVDLTKGGKRYINGVTDQILNLIDVLVDGPFQEENVSRTLKFRGSSNQRILEMKQNISN